MDWSPWPLPSHNARYIMFKSLSKRGIWSRVITLSYTMFLILNSTTLLAAIKTYILSKMCLAFVVFGAFDLVRYAQMSFMLHHVFINESACKVPGWTSGSIIFWACIYYSMCTDSHPLWRLKLSTQSIRLYSWTLRAPIFILKLYLCHATWQRPGISAHVVYLMFEK